MAQANDQFLDALEHGDLNQLRAIWREAMPGLPHDMTDDQALIVMHHARTQTGKVSLRARAYSHRFLTERGLPSGLPDDLRPKAERLYPVVRTAVGIAVSHSRPGAIEIRTAMEHAVLDADARGRLCDAPFVKARMDEAKAKTLRALFS